MGQVYQRLKMSAVHAEEMTIMVDTGATYSLISPTLADRLGVVRFPERYPVTLADCADPLLGVEALGVLGLAVDPTAGKLVPTRTWTARLGGVLASAAS